MAFFAMPQKGREKMDKIGIFGGSFNPPHIGHLAAARYAAQTLGLTKLMLIPSGQTPHKPVPALTATGAQRLAMVRLAFAGEPLAEVSSLELEREGESFTWDTVRQIRQENPDAELYLLLGTDMFRIFHQWKNADQLSREVTLVGMSRGEKGETEELAAAVARIEAMGGKAVLLKNPVQTISSSQVRRLLAFGGGVEFLPEGLMDYIRREKLYYVGADLKNLPMEQLEPVVVSLLKANRVNHVLGCRDTAVELAKRWGADPVDAARAGILHDITKALDGPLQLTLCSAYGKMLDDFSRKYPKTLHALTGSMVAEKIFGENKTVVSAIEFHTTGKANMNLLETIIYVADYMEPNRDFPGVDKLRELAFSDIRGALKLGLEMTLEHLVRQGGEVSPASRQALAYLNAQT